MSTGLPAVRERLSTALTQGWQVIARQALSFGQVTVLRFTQFEANPALPASLFRFVAPAGADVVGD